MFVRCIAVVRRIVVRRKFSVSIPAARRTEGDLIHFIFCIPPVRHMFSIQIRHIGLGCVHLFDRPEHKPRHRHNRIRSDILHAPIILRILRHRISDLPEIAETRTRAGPLPRPAQRRQKKSGKDCKNRNNNQKLYQSKVSLSFSHEKNLLCYAVFTVVFLIARKRRTACARSSSDSLNGRASSLIMRLTPS